MYIWVRNPSRGLNKCLGVWEWLRFVDVESNALNNWKLKIFNIIDERVLFYSNNLDLLPPKPKLSFRYFKQGIQAFHRKYVFAPAD